jgi:hypothetical protein
MSKVARDIALAAPVVAPTDDSIRSINFSRQRDSVAASRTDRGDTRKFARNLALALLLMPPARDGSVRLERDRVFVARADRDDLSEIAWDIA